MRFALLNTVWHPLKLFGRDNNKLETVHAEVLQYKLSLSYRLTLIMDMPKAWETLTACPIADIYFGHP